MRFVPSTYVGPSGFEYFLEGDYPGGDPGRRTLYQGSDKEVVSTKVARCIQRVQAFQGSRGTSKISGFTLYYRGKRYLRVESVLGKDGIRSVIRS